MIKIKAIQENIKKVKMIVSNNKCFCLNFNKLKEKLLFFFNNETIEQIIKGNKCDILNKPLKKIKKVCNLSEDI